LPFVAPLGLARQPPQRKVLPGARRPQGCEESSTAVQRPRRERRRRARRRLRPRTGRARGGCLSSSRRCEHFTPPWCRTPPPRHTRHLCTSTRWLGSPGGFAPPFVLLLPPPPEVTMEETQEPASEMPPPQPSGSHRAPLAHSAPLPQPLPPPLPLPTPEPPPEPPLVPPRQHHRSARCGVP